MIHNSGVLANKSMDQRRGLEGGRCSVFKIITAGKKLILKDILAKMGL